MRSFFSVAFVILIGLLLSAVGNRPSLTKVNHAKLPLAFAANEGQEDARVRFVTRAGGYAVLFTSDGLLVRDSRHTTAMSFPGANSAPVLDASGPLPTIFNYFIGNDPKQWRTNVHAYSRLVYRNIYPGIDLVFHGRENQMEYDFVVAPGADPRQIRVRVEAASGVRVSGGDIVLDSILRMKAPFVYQVRGNGKTPVTGSYVLSAANEIGFALGAYDRSLPLVIDPVLAYSTFLGGTGSDQANAIAVDSTGAAYITGFTSSLDFPTLPPGESAFGGSPNVFVAKLNPAGTALVYSTTIGGVGSQVGNGLAVDAIGNAYVTGSTSSLNFPSVGGFQQQDAAIKNISGPPTATTDAFVLKLNPQGNAIVYSSFLGGTGTDTGRGIAVDGSGNAYITGTTTSFDFPLKNALQTVKGDQQSFTNDAFVAKVNAAGNALVYSTYLGGNSDDQGLAVAVDSSGNTYVTGETSSTNFPTVNPLQAARGGLPNQSNYDAFVTKIDSAGATVAYSTYLGGSSNDIARGIAVDGAGNVYLTGSTGSRDFPVLPLQPLTGTAFVTKINAAGSVLVYSRPIGGNGSDNGVAVAVDGAGNAYVTGTTTSTNFPIVNGIERYPTDVPFFAGNFGFVMKLDPTGNTFLYSTLLGGGSESMGGIAVDGSGSAYVAGETFTVNYPVINAFQSQPGGLPDAIVAKIADQPLPSAVIFAGGIVNAASYSLATAPNGAVAPGSIVAIFGTNMTLGSRYAGVLPLPTTLLDTTVTFNGTAAPLFYVSSTQINAQVPFATPTGSVTVKVTRGDGLTATQTVNVAAVSPGIFTGIVQGVTLGAILHAKTFGLVTFIDPAVGGEYLAIYVTGLGALQQPVAEGTVPPSPPPQTTATPTVTIGGVSAPVVYSGLAAKFAGVYQVNVLMPTGIPTGAQPVQLMIGGVSSNAVTLIVR